MRPVPKYPIRLPDQKPGHIFQVFVRMTANRRLQIDAVQVARDGPWGLAKSRGNVRERIRAGEHKIGRGADVTNRGYVSATEGSSEPPDTRSG